MIKNRSKHSVHSGDIATDLNTSGAEPIRTGECRLFDCTLKEYVSSNRLGAPKKLGRGTGKAIDVSRRVRKTFTRMFITSRGGTQITVNPSTSLLSEATVSGNPSLPPPPVGLGT